MTEYEQALIQRVDLILAHAKKQSDSVDAIQSHTRGMIIFIIMLMFVPVIGMLALVLR